MLKLERTSVMNLENAMRGARNPMNSWGRMDSFYDENGEYKLGPNDLDLAKRLRKAGSDHRKFLRQVFVSVDVTAPLYWWKEYDTYKVATVANSTSTMHKIAHSSLRFWRCFCLAGAAVCGARFFFFVFAKNHTSEWDQALISATISAIATTSQQ